MFFCMSFVIRNLVWLLTCKMQTTTPNFHVNQHPSFVLQGRLVSRVGASGWCQDRRGLDRIRASLPTEALSQPRGHTEGPEREVRQGLRYMDNDEPLRDIVNNWGTQDIMFGYKIRGQRKIKTILSCTWMFLLQNWPWFSVKHCQTSTLLLRGSVL